MVFRSGWVAGAARASAELSQYVACNPERLSGEEVLHLLCCLPLRHLLRLASSVLSFLCFPTISPALLLHRPRATRRVVLLLRSTSSSSSSSSSSLSSSSSDGYDSALYRPHSD
ncbi:uncharacterized protein LOC109714856 [Ananas comosus]|uniref:Uncharacterized protein LOC109714856 n=1 Tax=Ananas comosus TaxID=4615 RepID=A0A6P5FFU0_ANACO|nr:uncharacterized protein LOC109714856 [Ananas comosus]XP_020095152.1 uncharacterized protein LOC109714856 [Ananas comosus]XP_020095153.1 uncharacterized protein LOC109714856 [Ananas comosus]XP_020095154.1 uncharacterized protein LOC109714856 [Ananas comosus]XP_020095155.1 uncharacterized protein LOC109714856 [Ananas comosus]XP_020095156.1 uncharacterized protein LOC109714856 [Ananas comosus]